MKTIQINLTISAEEYRRYYSGQAQSVRVRSVDGRIVQFPANSLRPFLSHTGIHGAYALELDDALKLVSLKKLD